MALLVGVFGFLFGSCWVDADFILSVKIGSVPLCGTEPMALSGCLLLQERRKLAVAEYAHRAGSTRNGSVQATA